MHIPSCLQNFKQLTELDLSNNVIERVPSFFSEMTELRVLNLSHNRIWSIDDLCLLSLLPNL